MLILSKRKKLLFIILAVAVVFACGTIYTKNRGRTEVVKPSGAETVPVAVTAVPTPVPEIKDIVVYVCGSVKYSQNVHLKEGARVEDAIKAAGGALKNADLNLLNLAHVLSDQEKVYIPKKGEAIPQDAAGGSAMGSGDPAAPSVVNINTATAEQLDSLPGVGPSTAQKIISYRKANGAFKTVDDLKNVSGIGDKKFGELKDFIIVK